MEFVNFESPPIRLLRYPLLATDKLKALSCVSNEIGHRHLWKIDCTSFRLHVSRRLQFDFDLSSHCALLGYALTFGYLFVPQQKQLLAVLSVAKDINMISSHENDNLPDNLDMYIESPNAGGNSMLETLRS